VIVRLDLTDEETAALLRELHAIIENDLSAVVTHPSVARLPDEIRSDGAATTTAARPG